MFFDELMSFNEEDLAEIKNPQAASSPIQQGQNQSSGYAESNQQSGGNMNQAYSDGGNNSQSNQGGGNNYGNNSSAGYNNNQPPNSGGNGGYGNNRSRGGGGNGSYGNNNARGGSGGYGNNQSRGGGGGGGNFKKKPEVIEDPYMPVTFYIDRDFPPEIKQRLVAVMSKMIAAGITVRYNGDDTEIHNAISDMSANLSEAYIPWKNFNQINTKHYWNTLTANHLAQTNAPFWDKVPDAVKAMLARNIRMLFGDKNNSITMALITWSPDGATKSFEVTKDTGRSSFIIKTAASYHFPVINVAKEGSLELIDKVFNLNN